MKMRRTGKKAGNLNKDITKPKRTEPTLKQYAERVKILHAIDRFILENKSPEKIAQATISNLRKLITCKRTSVVSFILEYDEARVLVADGDGETKLKPGDLIPLELFGDMDKLSRGEINLVKDLKKISNPSHAVKALIEEGVRTYINIPLISRGELIGLLNLGANAPGGISKQQMEISQEIADSLASSMELARLLDKVMKYQRELKRFSSKIIEAQEMERKRIAMELHDEMGQAMAAISLNLGALEKELSPGIKASVKETLTDSRKLADDAIKKVRELAFSLRPTMLDDFGLIPTLRGLINKYKPRAGFQIDFKASGFEKKLGAEVKTALYRVVQEALNNAVKHAQAKKVLVHLENNGKSVSGFIKDDGRGFDSNTVLYSDSPEKRIGLIGMRERVVFLGGSFNIQSSLGKGTEINFNIPLTNLTNE